MSRSLSIVSIVVVAAAIGARAFQPPPTMPHAQLVIVVDGLRPDSITPAVMPRLARLGQRGTAFTG